MGKAVADEAVSDAGRASERQARGRLGGFAVFNALIVLTVGTFAVHGLKDAEAREWVAWGVLFQLPHVAAVFALMAWRPGPLARAGGWAVSVGSFVFAGVLYGLALGAPKPVAVFGTIGGTLMMLGWSWIGMLALSGDRMETLLRGRRDGSGD